MLEISADPGLLFAVALTAKTCAWAAALFVLAAPPLAWLLARKKGLWIRALGFLTTLPIVFPPIALGYLLLLVLGRTGPVGSLLDNMGISIVFTTAAVYLAAFIAGLPLVVKPLQSALESSTLKDLEFAARVHGAKPMTVFFRVTLPLVRPSLLSGLLLGLSRASGEVGITMMLGGNISERTNTLSLEIFNAVSRADFDAANALCLLLSLFAAVIFLAAELLIRRSPRL